MLATGACGERRDAADLAVGVSPFDQLRGIDVVQLRSGGVRAVRRAAAPAPLEGLREPIGAYDVLFAVPGYDGTNGSWPNEDALVSYVEATREWPSDTSAVAAWRSAIRELQAGLGVAPTCALLTGPGFALRVAEWDQGNGWSVSATYAASAPLVADTVISARHSIAVRRQALTAQYPQDGQPNAHELPTWTRTACSGAPSTGAASAGTTSTDTAAPTKTP